MDGIQLLSAAKIGGPVKAIPVPYLSADTEIYGSGGFLLGYSLRNRSTTIDVIVSICDGMRSQDSVLSAIYLPLKSSKDFFTDSFGIPFNTSLFLAFISGEVSGSLWIRPA
jgi:hypothetical protein